MKELSKEMRIIKFAFLSISILVLIVGLFFSYLIAELNDAPGFVLIGTAIALGCSSLLYGLCEVIILLKRNNLILSEINKNLKK